MEYRTGNHTFHISYLELREQYYQFCNMTDVDFKENAVKAAHFACVVCYFKEVGLEASIGDMGIIHELLHLIDGDIPVQTFQEIRN